MVDSYLDLIKYAPAQPSSAGTGAAAIPAASAPAAPNVAPQSAAIPASQQQAPTQQQAPATQQPPPTSADDSMYGGLAKYAPQQDSTPQSTQSAQSGGVINGMPAGSGQDASLGPLSISDRAALSLGNPQGRLEYLQNKFPGNVAKDTDGKLMVSDGKGWFNAEDSNPWDLSKKLATALVKGNPLMVLPRALAHQVFPNQVDAPQLSDITAPKMALASSAASNLGGAITTAGMVGGGAAGTAVAPGVGSVAGAGVGAAAADGIRTSLGRIVGTYDATPDEQLKDAGWEGLLGMGGEVLGIGAKPVAGMLKNALGTVADYAPNIVKQQISAVYGHLTGAGEWAVRRAVDDPDAVMQHVASVVKSVGNDVEPTVAVAEAQSRQNTLVKSMAEQGKAALQANYKQGEAKIISAAGSDFKADPGAIMKEIQQSLADQGLGKFVPKGSQQASKTVAAMGESLTDSGAAKAAGPMEFRPLSPAEIDQRMQQSPELGSKILGEKSKAAMQEISDLTNQWAGMKNVNGPQGAKMLLDFKKAIGQTFEDFFTPETPQAVKQMVYGIKDSINEKIGQRFADAGLGDVYTDMNAKYAANKESVGLFTDAVDKGQIGNLVTKLASGAKKGSGRELAGDAGTVANLIGKNGSTMMNQVFDLEASKGFFPFTHKGAAGNSAMQVARFAAGLGQQTNPRVVLQQLPYANATAEFLKGLGKGPVVKMLQDPNATGALFKSALGAYNGQSQVKQQLMGAAGQHLQNSALPQPQPTDQ